MPYKRTDDNDDSENLLDLSAQEAPRSLDEADGGAGLEFSSSDTMTEAHEARDRTMAQKESKDKTKVAWSDLPNKRQLTVIVLARMSEPLVQTSLQAYMFYQLKWFAPDLPDSAISAQSGMLHASFTAAQFLTAMVWGRVADSKSMGRKTVLLIGLCGTTVSALGFGFSKSFAQALFFRTVGGITNGNTGVMRTMISEIVREKKYQSRAFLLLPMTFNIGIIIGPILGGVLSDPAGSYPDVFGNVKFFQQYPYALPNLVSAVFLASSALAVWFGLEETLEALRDGKPDLGTRIGRKLAALLFWKNVSHSRHASYEPLLTSDVEMSPGTGGTTRAKRRYTQRLPFRQIFTRNVAFTFMAHFLMALHIGTFNSLWFVLLSTPVWDPETSDLKPHLPFRFTGGLGLQPRSVGLAMACLGVIGIVLQLVLFPRISGWLGTVRAWRFALCCFPVAYFLVPYLSVVPSRSPPPHAKDGVVVWVAILGLLSIQVLGRTFAIPSQTILVNNCTPHPSVLGTVHGLGQSVSSAGRTIGPMVGGVIYGYGLNKNIVGLVFWLLGSVGICGYLASLLVREGDGHEIWLAGDDEETEDSDGRPDGPR